MSMNLRVRDAHFLFRVSIVHLDDLEISWEGYILFFRGKQFEITTPFSINRYIANFGSERARDSRHSSIEHASS